MSADPTLAVRRAMTLALRKTTGTRSLGAQSRTFCLGKLELSRCFRHDRLLQLPPQMATAATLLVTAFTLWLRRLHSGEMVPTR